MQPNHLARVTDAELRQLAAAQHSRELEAELQALRESLLTTNLLERLAQRSVVRLNLTVGGECLLDGLPVRFDGIVIDRGAIQLILSRSDGVGWGEAELMTEAAFDRMG